MGYWLAASGVVVVASGEFGLQIQGPQGYMRLQGLLNDVEGSLVLSTRFVDGESRTLRLTDTNTEQTTVIPEDDRAGRWQATLAGEDVISAVGNRSLRLYEPDTGVETVLVRLTPEQLNKHSALDATSKYAAWAMRRRNHTTEERVVDLHVYNLRTGKWIVAPQGKALIHSVTVGTHRVTFFTNNTLKAVPLGAPRSETIVVPRFSVNAEIDDVAGDLVAWRDAKGRPQVTRFAAMSSGY